MLVFVPISSKTCRPDGCGVELAPAAVGVASGGLDADFSQAANTNIATRASEITAVILLVMFSSSGNAWSMDVEHLL
jgi:hypothetical protein